MKKVLLAILILILKNGNGREWMDFKKYLFLIIKPKEVIEKLVKITLILVLMIMSYKDLVILLNKEDLFTMKFGTFENLGRFLLSYGWQISLNWQYFVIFASIPKLWHFHSLD